MSVSDGLGRKGRSRRIAALAFVALIFGRIPGARPVSGRPGPACQTAPEQTSLATPAIPDAGFALGWAKARPLRTFTGQDLFNQIDGGADIFLEFGFVRLRVQAYARGKVELTINAYEMESTASALGIYLMKMGQETPFPEIAARNSSEEAQMTIVKGRFFVQVDNVGDVRASKAEAVALANAFLTGVEVESAPTPLGLLPPDGKVAGSERLIRGPYGLQPYFTFGEGDVLSLGGRVFGALAEYRMANGTSFTRLIVPYPDQDAAIAALAHLRANLDPYLKVSRDRPDGFDFVDFQGQEGSVARSVAVLDIHFKEEGRRREQFDEVRPDVHHDNAVGGLRHRAASTQPFF